MKVEMRMDEFQKVANKEPAHDVSELMDEFEKVNKTHVQGVKDKEATLPLGIKSRKPCPECGGIMEIKEIKENKASYYCKVCKETVAVSVE